ncbi:MAG: histidine triad nucleotide-binding protein [Treponema sp.]|nr:histidine triad nucleotide-binding protein [Treponema sp.]
MGNGDDCIFCKIIRGEIPSKKIFEDEQMLAFYDIDPKAPVHFIVIPKRHISNLSETKAGDTEILGSLVFKAQELAAKLGCGENGFRLVINCKSDGGQTVDHLHIHILGGRSLKWPPG